jgi:hypothetical protein
LTHLRQLLPLLCCIVGELLLQTSCRNWFGPFVSPLLHFLFSLGSGLWLLYYNRGIHLQKNTAALPQQPIIQLNKKRTKAGWIRLSLMPMTILVLCFFLNRLFAKHPINMLNPFQTGSDVIPQIMFFVTRAVHGTYPYSPITAPLWGYTLTPTYMPFQWIPYIPAELLHFDYRWIPIIILFAGLIFFQIRVEKSGFSNSAKWILTFLPLLILNRYYKCNHEESINTVEVLVSTYYLFFGLALTAKKPLLIAAAIVLCLLSRYAIVLWLPLFFLIYLFDKGFKKTLVLGLLVLVGVLLFYGPFLWKDPSIFKNAYEYYNKVTPGEWKMQPWQSAGSYPPHLERGLGLAIYFYKACGANITEAIRYIRVTHLFLCLSVITILSIYFLRNRNTVYPIIFAIASLKIYLTFFYGFIQIPYSYLYVLPMIFNIPVLYAAFLLLKIKKTNTHSPILQS